MLSVALKLINITILQPHIIFFSKNISEMDIQAVQILARLVSIITQWSLSKELTMIENIISLLRTKKLL